MTTAEKQQTNLHYLIKNYSNYSKAKQAYIRKVITKLRQFSLEVKNTPNMINEWSFTNTKDNVREVDYLKCELCGQPENVYQFKIINKKTGKHIWTGSVCIENFSIPVYDKDGKRITDEKKIEKIFQSNVKEIKEQRRLDLIQALINDINTTLEKKGDLNQFTYASDDEGIFTLKQLKYLSVLYFKAFNDFISEDYVKLFKVNMRLKRNKQELLNLKPFHWAQFSPIFGKYIFTYKNGFNRKMRQDAIKIIDQYRPENLDKFLKKVED